MHVFGFDSRHYAEFYYLVTVLKLPCLNPLVYIPKNFTTFDKIEAIPKFTKSEQLQFEGIAVLICTEPMQSR